MSVGLFVQSSMSMERADPLQRPPVSGSGTRRDQPCSSLRLLYCDVTVRPRRQTPLRMPGTAVGIAQPVRLCTAVCSARLDWLHRLCHECVVHAWCVSTQDVRQLHTMWWRHTRGHVLAESHVVQWRDVWRHRGKVSMWKHRACRPQLWQVGEGCMFLRNNLMHVFDTFNNFIVRFFLWFYI